MKFLLATLSTLSIGSPIVTTTVHLIDLQPTLQSSMTGENLVGLATGSSQPLDTTLGHEEKLNYIGDNEVTEGSVNTHSVYVSNNYTVNPNVNDLRYIKADNPNFDDPSPVSPAFYHTPNQFILENKTFSSTSDFKDDGRPDSNGHITWIDQITDENGVLTTFERETPISYDQSASQFAPCAVPFTYFNDNAQKKDGKPQSFILSKSDDNKTLKFLKVNSNANYAINTPDDDNYKAFEEVGDISDIVSKAGLEDEWVISSFFGQNFSTYNDNLKKSGMLNKIIVGLYSKTEKQTKFFAFNSSYENNQMTLNANDNLRWIETSDAMDSYRLLATLDDGDIIFKTGSGNSATYALASYLTDSNQHNDHIVDDKIKKGSDVLTALNLSQDDSVANMFSTSDHQLMFQVEKGDAAGFKNSDFYYVDLGKNSNKLEFNKSFKLLSTDEYVDYTDPQYNYLQGFPNVVTGKITDTDHKVSYYFIATVSLQQKVIVYKYKNVEQLSSRQLGGINDSIDKSPILETIFQSAGFLGGKNSSNVTSLAFVNNNFLISNATGVTPIPFIASVSEKISNNEITGSIGETVELTKTLYDSISAAYPDLAKNNDKVRYAFLQALVTGHFVYDSVFTEYPFSKSEPKEYTNDDIQKNSIIGKLKGNFQLLTEALNGAKFSVDGEIITSPYDKKQDAVLDNGLVINVDSTAFDDLVHYKQYGTFENNCVITLNSNGKNSFIKGSVEVKATSQGLSTSLDVNDINKEVKEKIQADYSDFNIDGYDTPGEVTGYILNKINEVIYDESRKYSSDSQIGKLLKDLDINPSVIDHEDAVVGWNEYKTFPEIIQTNLDSFDGTRPLTITHASDINSTTFGNDVTSEDEWRRRMDWGWQDSENNITDNEHDTTTVNLTNIVLTSNNSSISVVRGNNNVIKSDSNPNGILNYGNNKVSDNSVVLNIGEIDKNDPSKINNLKATVNKEELEKISDGDFEDAKLADLDTAAKKLNNIIIGGDGAGDKTSLFRYFEKIKSEYDLAQNVQITLDNNMISKDNYFMPTGDIKKFNIIVYDALFFADADKLDSKVLNLNDINNQNNNHYRVVSVYISNGQNKSKNESIIIFASVFGGATLLLFVSYTIYVSMRKSFYKRGTTREQAKMAAFNKKASRNIKDKHEKD